MSDLVIMVDLDGTLKTESDAVGPFEVDSLTVTSGPKKYTFGARPHMHEFLIAGKSKAKLYLGTAGGGGYARRVLNAMGIDNYFDGIIAAENFRDGMSCFREFTNAIYIDNDEEIARLKISKIQGTYLFRNSSRIPNKQDMWIIDTFLGKKDDKTLLELAEEIRRL